MTLKERIKLKILKFLGLEKLAENPNNDRYTYLGNPETIIRAKAQENKVWYYGDSNELKNYYTAQETYGNARNPIYNTNRAQYFWGLSSIEKKIKRVHSGVPNAIVTTIVNLVGMPQITSDEYQDGIEEMEEATDFKNLINQKQMPMTLVVGWGALKPVIDKDVDPNNPLFEWYDGEDVQIIKKHDRIIAILFSDYFKINDDDYVLTETRRVVNGNARFEFNLFKLDENNDVQEIPLDSVEQFKEYKSYEIPGLNKVMGVPSIFFYDQYNKDGGRSIFTGKVDLFDDLDQALSQASRTCRLSTPVEYIPVDLLKIDRNGEPELPERYDREYIASDAYPNGDGEIQSGKIQTTQPQLNFSQYNDECLAILDMILTGLLSPVTFGLNIAKGDSGVAQREKEKTSIMMRNNVIDKQQIFIKEAVVQWLIFKEYMTTGKVTITDYDISVKFDEYANPSFESISPNLLSMLNNGGMSPEMYVEKLYGDSISEEEKQREIEYIKQKQQADEIDTSGFEAIDGGINNDERSTTTGDNTRSNVEEEPNRTEEPVSNDNL